MFLGHFAVGFAAKRLAPAVSLGLFFLACQLADLVWPLLVLSGVEHVTVNPGITEVTPLDFVFYPYSHSLAAMAGWAALLALISRAGLRLTAGATITIAAVVLSHWALDFVAHRPDLPIAIGGDVHVGLGLWRSRTATLIVEGALLAGGAIAYALATRPVDRIGRWAFASLIVFLYGTYLASVFGPPPPDERSVALAANAMWLLVAWGFWIDRHRRPREVAG